VSEQAQASVEMPIVLHGPMNGEMPVSAEMREASDEPATATVSVLDVVPTTITQTDPATTPQVATSTERADGLDMFRGILLLLMNLAYTIPHWGPFPGWMYHQQVPPAESAKFVEIAGLTWRDTLFPGFLFTMSAALPIAFGARLAKRFTYPHVTWLLVRRAALLMLMAFVIGHTNPYWTKDYTKVGNVIAIAGLLACFAFFVRPRTDWSAGQVKWLRRVAWGAMISVLFIVPWVTGTGFSPDRRDGILSAIAFSTVAGGVIWLFTRTNIAARLAILAVVLVGRTVASQVGWVGSFWYSTPASWLYEPWYLDLLTIVIPGTIAGDLLARWSELRRADGTTGIRWPTWRFAALAALGFSIVPVLCVGLYQRQYPTATAATVLTLAAAMLVLTANAETERERIIRRLYSWAAFWLVIGVLLEPLEGGIKKDPQTLGYLTLMTGAAIAGLASLHLGASVLRAPRAVTRPMVEIGQNPLFAYVIFSLGIGHVLWLSGAGAAFTQTWPQALLRSITLTAVVGLIVWLATRRRLLWRA
jgi:hypothetical protein